jgi:hypothetical protein
MFVLLQQSVLAVSLVGHSECPICAHLTAKHGNIVELGIFSVTGTITYEKCCSVSRVIDKGSVILLCRFSNRKSEFPKSWLTITVSGRRKVGKSRA